MTPNEDDGHRVADFPESWKVFGWAEVTEEVDPIHDQWIASEIDVAPVLWGHTLFTPAGEHGELVVGSEGQSYVVMASAVDLFQSGMLHYSAVEVKFFSMYNESGNFIPVMYGAGATNDDDIVVVGGHFNEYHGFRLAPEDPQAQGWPDYGFVRVAARATAGWIEIDPPGPENDFCAVEVTCAYANQLDYAIEVATALFDIYKDGSSVEMHTYGGVDYEAITDTGANMHPDIEYDYMQNDLHLVYTTLRVQPEEPDAKVYYRRREDGDGETFTARTWISDDDGDGGWVPRIDVGLVDNPAGYGEGTRRIVAVVYSRQEVNPLQDYPGFRPAVSWWDYLDGPSPHFNYVMADGQYEGQALISGVPVIDIAPESNPNHDAHVAFAQQVAGNGQPIQYQVRGVGHAFQEKEEELDIHYYDISPRDPDESWTHHSSILPSVGVHYDGIGGVENEMSVTYLFQCSDPTNPWNLEARRVKYETGQLGPETYPPANARGYFNISDIQYFNYGTSTGLAVAESMDEPAYWAAWSDSIGYNCLPCEISATFGYTIGI